MPTPAVPGENSNSRVSAFPGCTYFDVTAEEGKIVLRPVAVEALSRVQDKLQELGITEGDIATAVRWARGRDR